MQKGKIWLCGLAGALAVMPALAQDDGADRIARRAAAREMIMAHEDKIADAAITTVSGHYVAQMRKLHPEITEDRLQALKKLIEANLTATRSDYLDHEIDIYAKQLSVRELQSVTAFYKTDAGKKLVEIIPSIFPELADAQLDWTSAAVTKATASINSSAKAPQ